jgi:cytochrome c peroxidase
MGRHGVARAASSHIGTRLALAAALVFGVAIGLKGTSPDARSGRSVSSERLLSSPFLAEYARPGQVPHPEDNAYTPARETLGRMLFFDPRLSGSNWISCASCHNPALSWGDGLPRAIGHGMQELGRRTPTILNLAWAEAMFWDGRADTLEAQALGPIQAAGEMNLALDKMIDKIAALDGYRRLFAAAYPGEPIAPATIAKAIATFERRVVSSESAFDRWVAGDDEAIDADARRGFVLFNTTARCSKCHTGWRFTDDSFHDIGVAGADQGRGVLFKDIPVMQHAFKTPTLRDADRRAPYMHDGSVATLADVVDFYDRGGDAKRDSLSPDMKRLGLSAEEKRQLVAFLHTLTGPETAVVVPALPR